MKFNKTHKNIIVIILMIIYVFMAIPAHYLHSHSIDIKSISKIDNNSFSENKFNKIGKVYLECSVCKLLNSNVQEDFSESLTHTNDGLNIPSLFYRFQYQILFTNAELNRGPPSIV